MIPERSAVLLFVLNRLGEVVTELKLQKLVFQIQNKAKAPRGYRYFKHYYGPYSRELSMDTFTLMKDGLLEKELKFGENERQYSIFRITEKGKAFFEDNMVNRLSPGLIKRMENVLDEYSVYSYNRLAKIVYQEWKIEKPNRIQTEIVEVQKDLEALTHFWEAAYFPECPAITYFLAYSEYCREALEKVCDNDDVVVRSILVRACQELRDILSGIAEVCSKKDVCPLEAEKGICRNPDPSVFEVFHFIEDFCEQNKLLPKLCNRDLNEMMTEEEYTRLRKALKTLDSCSFS
jgi:uncharacterized protein YwgA